MEILLIGIFLGVLIGTVLALTGAGGTIIAVPLLISGMHLTVAEAAPIALFAVCVSSAIAAMLAHRQGKVRYRAAGFIAIAGIMTAPLGIWLAQRLPDIPLTILFALVLFYIAISMLRQSKRQVDNVDFLPDTASIPCRLSYEQGRLIWNWPCARALAFSGIIAGFLSGLLGVGGGFVVIPALRKATNLPMQSILATALAVVALVSATGVASAVFIGSMNWLIALPFAAGALAGMLIGRKIADHLAGPGLQQGFAVVVMGVSIWMVVRLLWVNN